VLWFGSYTSHIEQLDMLEKVKLSLLHSGRHMGELEVLLHLFLVSALDGDERVDFKAGSGIF